MSLQVEGSNTPAEAEDETRGHLEDKDKDKPGMFVQRNYLLFVFFFTIQFNRECVNLGKEKDKKHEKPEKEDKNDKHDKDYKKPHFVPTYNNYQMAPPGEWQPNQDSYNRAIDQMK